MFSVSYRFLPELLAWGYVIRLSWPGFYYTAGLAWVCYMDGLTGFCYMAGLTRVLLYGWVDQGYVMRLGWPGFGYITGCSPVSSWSLPACPWRPSCCCSVIVWMRSTCTWVCTHWANCYWNDPCCSPCACRLYLASPIMTSARWDDFIDMSRCKLLFAIHMFG